MSAPMAVVVALSLLVILGMVALVAKVVWVGVFGSTYDVDACMAAYGERKAEGESPVVMEPSEHEGLVA